MDERLDSTLRRQPLESPVDRVGLLASQSANQLRFFQRMSRHHPHHRFFEVSAVGEVEGATGGLVDA